MLLPLQHTVPKIHTQISCQCYGLQLCVQAQARAMVA